MNHLEKEKQQSEVEKYLEKKKIFDFFQILLQEICVKKPLDPIQYLIDRLTLRDTFKLIVLGKPGGSAPFISQELEKRFNLHMVDVYKLVHDEESKDSEFGTLLRNQKAAGVERYDDIDVVSIVADYINTHDMFQELDKYNDNNTKKGQVLFNFPINVHQAQLFQTTGHLATRVFHLQEEDHQCRRMHEVSMRKTYPEMTNEQIDEKFTRELNYYNMQIDKVLDVLKQGVYSLNLHEGNQKQAVNNIFSQCFMKVSQKVHTPPKISLYGTPCCGKSHIVELCEQKQGLVQVDIKLLIQQEAIKDSPLSIQCKEAMDKGEQLSEEVMAKLISNRLSEPDCRLNGQVLDDFPQTQQQQEFLLKAGHCPTHAVYKDFPYDEMHKLRKQYQFDPVLNRLVRQNENQLNELNPSMRKRLVQSAQQTEKCVEMRYHAYQRNKDSLVKFAKKNQISVYESKEDESIDIVIKKLEEDIDKRYNDQKGV